MAKLEFGIPIKSNNPWYGFAVLLRKEPSQNGLNLCQSDGRKSYLPLDFSAVTPRTKATCMLVFQLGQVGDPSTAESTDAGHEKQEKNLPKKRG